MIGMRRAERRKFIGRTGILKAAPGIQIGENDDFLRAQYLGSIRHELDATKGNDIGIGRGGST